MPQEQEVSNNSDVLTPVSKGLDNLFKLLITLQRKITPLLSNEVSQLDAQQLQNIEDFYHTLDARGVGFRAMDPDTGKPTVYLWPNSTALQVKHELSHYLDCKRLGPENYSSLSPLQKEQMVLDRLQNKKKFWNKLNMKEREFSIDYVETIASEMKDIKIERPKNVNKG